MLELYLDYNKFGAVTVYPLALMGCLAWGRNEADALAALPAAVDAWAEDMRRYGAVVAEIDAHDHVIVERAESDPLVKDETFSCALFEAEIRPISQGEVNDTLALAQLVRGDLHDLIRGLDGNTLNYKPVADMPSIRQIVQHIGGADHWYITRLMTEQQHPTDWHEVQALPLRAFLTEERKRVMAYMSTLSDEQRAAVITSPHFTARPDEQWTVRKVLRRMIAHEREHIAEIRRYFDILATTC